jgi:hypothetical protein
MVSLLNISFIGILISIVVVVVVQTNPLVETSNDINETKPTISNQQLYELYKIMREDPRLAAVSNHDLVSYIYRNFVLGKSDDIEFVKPKTQNQRRHRHQKANKAE